MRLTIRVRKLGAVPGGMELEMTRYLRLFVALRTPQSLLRRRGATGVFGPRTLHLRRLLPMQAPTCATLLA